MIDEKVQNLIPKLEALLQLWRHRYGARPVPKLGLLTTEDLQPWSRNVALIEHGADGRFYIRTFGIDLIRRFGRESTGYCIDDLARTSARACMIRFGAAFPPVRLWRAGRR